MKEMREVHVEKNEYVIKKDEDFVHDDNDDFSDREISYLDEDD